MIVKPFNADIVFMIVFIKIVLVIEVPVKVS